MFVEMHVEGITSGSGNWWWVLLIMGKYVNDDSILGGICGGINSVDPTDLTRGHWDELAESNAQHCKFMWEWKRKILLVALIKHKYS